MSLLHCTLWPSNCAARFKLHPRSPQLAGGSGNLLLDPSGNVVTTGGEAGDPVELGRSGPVGDGLADPNQSFNFDFLPPLTTASMMASPSAISSIIMASTSPAVLSSDSGSVTAAASALSSTLSAEVVTTSPGGISATSPASLSTIIPSSSSAYIPPSSSWLSPSSSISSALPTTSAAIAVSSLTSSPSSGPSSISSASSHSSTPTPSTSSAVNVTAFASKHTPTFYLGIALGAIAGFVFLIAFVAFCVRICSRRRKTSDNTEPWPWDRENRDYHLESGLDGLHGSDPGRWPVREMLGEKSEASKTGYTRRDPFGIQYPTGAVLKDGILHGTPKNPMLHGSPMMSRTPFVAVPSAHQSVPDLAHDIGRLQVTNRAPGDVASGDEGSRANSRQGVQRVGPGISPLQVFDRDNGEMVNIPLTPLQPKHSPTPKAEAKVKPCLAPPPPQPQRGASESSTSLRSEGWAASIRSNIANAFSAVIRSQSSSSSSGELLPAKQLSTSSEDSYYLKRNPDSLGRIAYDGLEIPIVCLEPVDDSGGSDWDDLSAWMTSKGNTPYPQEESPASKAPSVPVIFATAPLAVNKSKLLPPPVSRTSTCESTYEEEILQNPIQLRRSRRVAGTRRSTKIRPVLTGRASSASVGSEMSRASSTSSGPLTEQEKLAKLVLRERRRRVLGMRCDQRPAQFSSAVRAQAVSNKS